MDIKCVSFELRLTLYTVHYLVTLLCFTGSQKVGQPPLCLDVTVQTARLRDSEKPNLNFERLENLELRNIFCLRFYTGQAMAQLTEALRYKPEELGFDSDGFIGFFH